jgi:glycerol-3-phosphate acyltransferase PlsY
MPLDALLPLLAYLIGSVSGSLLLGKLRGVDIRTLGSGNAGGTNAFRTQGWRFASGVALIDIGKGALAAWLGWRFGSHELREWIAWTCALAAILGHIWPLYHGFRGGKGAATLIGGLAVLWPWALAPMVGAWLLCLLLGGYVGLATVLAVLLLAVLAWVGGDPARTMLLSLAALLVVYAHRDNLRRLRAGTENRFERARVLGRWLFGPRA